MAERNYKCGVCGRCTETVEKMREHYRDKHPEDGYSCWDVCGLGDPLAESALRAMRESHRRDDDELKVLRAWRAEWARNANIIRLAVEMLPK